MWRAFLIDERLVDKPVEVRHQERADCLWCVLRRGEAAVLVDDPRPRLTDAEQMVAGIRDRAGDERRLLTATATGRVTRGEQRGRVRGNVPAATSPN